jgi:hypothetical protein
VSKLKDVSLGIGNNTPKDVNAYKTDHGRGDKLPKIAPVPRAGDGLAVGETGGNFQMDMGKIGINASPTGTQSGSEAAQSAFVENSK